MFKYKILRAVWTINQMTNDHSVDPWRDGWNVFVDHNSSYKAVTWWADGDDEDSVIENMLKIYALKIMIFYCILSPD